MPHLDPELEREFQILAELDEAIGFACTADDLLATAEQIAELEREEA